MTPDPIEAVARALCLRAKIDPDTLDGYPHEQPMIRLRGTKEFVPYLKWYNYVDDARAAIAAMPKVEQQAARIAELEAEVARRDRNEARNCINWGPCSQHDGQMSEPDTIGYVDDTGGPR